MAEALDVVVYFTHAYNAWQRARSENANGLMRPYLPKRTSFKHLSKDRDHQIVEALNNSPMKEQHSRTPNEVFCEQSVALEA